MARTERHVFTIVSKRSRRSIVVHQQCKYANDNILPLSLYSITRLICLRRKYPTCVYYKKHNNVLLHRSSISVPNVLDYQRGRIKLCCFIIKQINRDHELLYISQIYILINIYTFYSSNHSSRIIFFLFKCCCRAYNQVAVKNEIYDRQVLSSTSV